jgi:threonylcarbamoyladenosine tRNA methylthiotransferase MtaB
MRVRLGSLEPRIVTEKFCERLKKFPNLCPQFHLSMQSGCDTVLERMRRKYDTARYLQSVELLKAAFPGCAVTTDMIVGFPGETEEEFENSLEFIRKCGFADMHIFPLFPSPRHTGRQNARSAVECGERGPQPPGHRGGGGNVPGIPGKLCGNDPGGLV